MKLCVIGCGGYASALSPLESWIKGGHPMRVLLLCDDRFHPGDIPIRGVEPLKEKGITIDVIQNGQDFNPGRLKDYAVVIMSKCDHISMEDRTSWKTDAIQDSFVEYVENGGGLLVTHSGTVAGKHTGKLDRLIGCRFVSHPNQCPVTVLPSFSDNFDTMHVVHQSYPKNAGFSHILDTMPEVHQGYVKNAVKPHPVMEGVEMFIETDEHYNIEILTNDIEIIAAAYAPPQGEESKYESEPYFNTPGGIYPAAYVRTQGKGKVCVLTPGHNLEVWQNPNFQRLLENALRWCAG